MEEQKKQLRQFKITLGGQDSTNLKEIANILEINESEVLRKGLQLMALYAKAKNDPDNQMTLILRDKEGDNNVLIL
jgi:hypothetical protein